MAHQPARAETAHPERSSLEIGHLRGLVASRPTKRRGPGFAGRLARLDGIGKLSGGVVEYTAADFDRAARLLTELGIALPLPTSPGQGWPATGLQWFWDETGGPAVIVMVRLNGSGELHAAFVGTRKTKRITDMNGKFAEAFPPPS